jgi:hypothetical protein
MTAQAFILSNKPKHRLARHAGFWAVFCLLSLYSDLYGDSFSDVFTTASLKQSLSALICFIPLYVFSAYCFIGLLVPRYLLKKRYGRFVIGALMVALCNFMAGIFLSMLHFKILEWHFTGSDTTLAPIRTSIYEGIILAFIATGGMVTAIKLIKSWYLQQIENTKLTRLKTDKEIKLIKAQIQPAFLHQSLNILRKKIRNGEDDAPQMLLQLSELLSHLLYDADTEFISLGQELKMAKLLIDIKEFDRQRPLSATMTIQGDDAKKYISPLLLFSYLQTVLNDAERSKDNHNKLSIVLTIEDRRLFCELYGYTKADTEFKMFHLIKKAQPIGMLASKVVA